MDSQNMDRRDSKKSNKGGGNKNQPRGSGGGNGGGGGKSSTGGKMQKICSFCKTKLSRYLPIGSNIHCSRRKAEITFSKIGKAVPRNL